MNIFKHHQHFFELLFAMTHKEIKARYKKAAFGFLWIIINPLLQMFIIGIVFSYIVDIPDYFVFLITGLLPWQFFSLSLSKATPSFVHARTLIQKARFPRIIIPLSIVLSNAINLGMSLMLLFMFLLFRGSLDVPSVVYICLATLWLVSITTGLSIITSVYNVRFRDINFFSQSLLILWFYATPIIYTTSLVPKHFRYIFYINPLTTVFELVHYALIQTNTIPLILIIWNVIITIAVLVFAVVAYKKEEPNMADWL